MRQIFLESPNCARPVGWCSVRLCLEFELSIGALAFKDKPARHVRLCQTVKSYTNSTYSRSKINPGQLYLHNPLFSDWCDRMGCFRDFFHQTVNGSDMFRYFLLSCYMKSLAHLLQHFLQFLDFKHYLLCLPVALHSFVPRKGNASGYRATSVAEHHRAHP